LVGKGEEAAILLQRWERERGFKLLPWQRDDRERERESERITCKAGCSGLVLRKVGKGDFC